MEISSCDYNVRIATARGRAGWHARDRRRVPRVPSYPLSVLACASVLSGVACQRAVAPAAATAVGDAPSRPAFFFSAATQAANSVSFTTRTVIGMKA